MTVTWCEGELLPARLRVIEGVAWGGKLETAAFASGWVNSNKFASKQRFLEEMSKLNLILCENGDAREMIDTGFAFHSICPKVVELHEELRETLARSTLVRDHRFVFLVGSDYSSLDSIRTNRVGSDRFRSSSSFNLLATAGLVKLHHCNVSLGLHYHKCNITAISD